MIESKLAFLSTTDLPHRMKVLENNWEQFMIDNQALTSIRAEVYQSWKRCKSLNVNPLQKQSPLIMEEDKIMELINKSNLFDVSLPVIDELYNQVKGTENLITLSDENGRIIHLKGDYEIENKAQEMNFLLGADWSEKAAGSNAIGTSLASGQPIQILSFEHYCEGVHPWVCSAAPIRDPITRKILGVIDLTAPSKLAQPHSLTVVQSISSIIEQKLLAVSYQKIDHLESVYRNVKRSGTSTYVIVLNEILNVVRGDPECLSLFQIEDWKLLWNHEELARLKYSLLNNSNDGHEWEWNISSLQLKVFIQRIILEEDQIGFVFCVEKIYQFNPFDSQTKTTLKGVIGTSMAMKKVIQKANIISKTNVSILLTGESGTGKEVFAYAIHQKSARENKPFIAINCGAIPADLIGSELFGYEAGAFTGGNPKGKIGKFEEAKGGTILLDEIGEMPLDLQVHLLRVLQEKEIVRLGSSFPIPIDVRIIAATNKNLKKLVEDGLFRSDLYYRLNVVELTLPPLAERKEDITLLTNSFAIELAKTHGKEVPTVSNEVLKFFHKYHWPGNIRELMNVMEYAVLFCEDNQITVDSLPKLILKNNEITDDLTPLEYEEKKKIEQLIYKTNRNLSEVARLCQIARTTLYRKIKKYNLEYIINSPD